MHQLLRVRKLVTSFVTGFVTVGCPLSQSPFQHQQDPSHRSYLWLWLILGIPFALSIFCCAGIFGLWIIGAQRARIEPAEEARQADELADELRQADEWQRKIEAEEAQKKADEDARIGYDVVEEWSMGDRHQGGRGMAIVINPANRNADDLKALGKQLKNDLKDNRFTAVMIYDDVRAAALRKQDFSDRLDGPDSKHHSLHMVGSYLKNNVTGHHRLNIHVNGAGSEDVEMIDY